MKKEKKKEKASKREREKKITVKEYFISACSLVSTCP